MSVSGSGGGGGQTSSSRDGVGQSAGVVVGAYLVECVDGGRAGPGLAGCRGCHYVH